LRLAPDRSGHGTGDDGNPTKGIQVAVLALILVALVALEHIYILVLEMFLWTSPRGMKAFNMSREKAESTKVMAANQGLYNGFLAAGLIWALIHPDAAVAFQLKLFFLGCVVALPASMEVPLHRAKYSSFRPCLQP
jgi:putative membrane protein